jgi:hypothetical protein
MWLIRKDLAQLIRYGGWMQIAVLGLKVPEYAGIFR